MDVEAAAILKKRVAAVLNTSSGGCDATSAGKMRAVLDRAGLTDATVKAVAAAEIEAALDEAIAAADLLIVFGGDGTVRAAAEKCGARGVVLAPLPGGTMNMLPRALYGARGWEQALSDSLADPETRTVSGGRAGERLFYCVAILGTPTLWADVREALRRFDLARAVKRAAIAIRRGGRGNRLSYELGDSVKGSAEAVAVICPMVSRRLAEDARTLEAAALDPETAAQVAGLALHAMLDDWRNDPSVERAKVKTVRVKGYGPIPVILDGETVRMGRSVTLSFEPVAFRALAPAHRS